MDRDLKKGDIIRTKVGNKDHPNYNQFAFAVCSGSGFGCSMSTIGNAIYVDHQSFDLKQVLANINKTPNMKTSNRWERFWGIEYLADAKKVLARKRKETYFIIPFNEGQELNYIETFEGTLIEATSRAVKIGSQLKRTLTQGTITIEVQDIDGNNVFKKVE